MEIATWECDEIGIITNSCICAVVACTWRSHKLWSEHWNSIIQTIL